jgi:hypothetical protein
MDSTGINAIISILRLCTLNSWWNSSCHIFDTDNTRGSHEAVLLTCKRTSIELSHITAYVKFLNAMNDHFYAQIEIYTLNIIIVIHVCKFKFAQIWNRLQRSFWEPGIKLTLNLAWRFCGNKCPIVLYVILIK